MKTCEMIFCNFAVEHPSRLPETFKLQKKFESLQIVIIIMQFKFWIEIFVYFR